MLGKSVGAGAVSFALLVALSCAHNVPQDSNTGADGRPKGAKSIVLENGEGKAHGIVTYPGGDRADWKLVELPEKQRGILDIELKWRPPRPNLQLSFDVFDEWFTPIFQPKGGKKGRVRSGSVENAKGKYYIRVFAVGRGDAGKYDLTVNFKESNGPISIDLAKVELQDPPKLPGIPEAEFICDDTNFDQKKPECRNFCPANPPSWAPCKDKCPTPPDVNNPACWKTMPCPKPADRRVLACRPKDFPKCADINNPDPDNPNCDHATAPPQVGRVNHIEAQGSDLIVTIGGAGENNGVNKTWTGKVLRGDGDTPLEGGDVIIVRVGKKETVGKVHLTPDQINQNPRVKLSPPPK
jgi:hypothetical protein